MYNERILKNKNQIKISIYFSDTLHCIAVFVFDAACIIYSILPKDLCASLGLFSYNGLSRAATPLVVTERGRHRNRKGNREPYTNGSERMMKSLHLQGKAFMALVLLCKGIFSSASGQAGSTEFISKYKLCSALTYA